MSKDVVIIGGGVVGAMCAYHLANRGKSVAIVEARQFGAACSHGNCGYVSPSHVLPLTQPGAVRQNFFTAFRKSSSLYIKPRLSPSLMKWMLNFARRCNQRDMMHAAEALHAMLQSSRTLYGGLIEAEQIDCDWEAGGLLFVFRTRDGFDHYRGTATELTEKFGLEIDEIGQDRLLKLEPALKPESTSGGFSFPGDAHLRPDRLMRGMRTVLEQLGVDLIENAPMTALRRENGKASGVQYQGGEIEADRVVIATGAFTPMLNEKLGLRVPIQPGKGYSLTMPRPSICPTRPMIFEQDHVAITPWKSGYRIGSTMEFSGYDATLNPARLENLRRVAAKYLKEPAASPELEQWFGWRPMTWDSLPIIDRSPADENVWLAVGHNMLGISMATGTGRLIAELMDGDTPHVDPAPYSALRF